LLVGCGKAKPTPDATANKLFFEAVRLISSAEEQTGEVAIKDYEQALGKLGEIIADYSESDLAVKLISGERLFTGKSLKEIKERVAELKRVAAESAVVINAPPPERSLEVQFLDGELNGADLEEVTKLDLDGYQLTELPKNLENLTQLKVLVLSKNQLTEIPKGLEKLTQLMSLNLKDNPDLTKAQIAELQKALPKCKISSNPTK